VKGFLHPKHDLVPEVRMSIPQIPGGDRTYPYLLSEPQIQAFVDSLRINHSAAITQRLNATFLAIIEMIQNKLDNKPTEIHLLVIKKIARDYKNKQFQRLMKSIIAALEPGKEKLSPAFHTITRVMELVYAGLPEYMSAREFYKEMLKEIEEQEGEK
jgi:hypothetical protein